MPTLIAAPARIPVPGGKLIEEYIGRVNSKDTALSIAHMRSPAGWSEPGQRPEFDEFTIVLRGSVTDECEVGIIKVPAGQGVITRRGELIRYIPPPGADYIAV